MPRPLDDAPNDLLEQARLRLKAERAVNRHAEQGRRLARRIVFAFVLVVLTAVAFFVVVPVIGVKVPMIVPILCFITIVLGAVMAHAGDSPDKGPTAQREEDCGCAVGCCPGPRPLKAFGNGSHRDSSHRDKG